MTALTSALISKLNNMNVTAQKAALGTKLSQIYRITATVAYSAFTDGGGASGTYALAETIPVGAHVIQSTISAITGFTGNVSAVITIGDGSDVDRYNTGTPSVFTTAAGGVAAGAVSGTAYHTTAATVTLTVTGNSDFTAISAGSVTVNIFYLMSG